MKIIKIPWSLGSMNKNPGCKNAPDKILEEFNSIYLNEDGIDTQPSSIEEIKINESNFEETNNNIIQKINECKQNAIILGGDHSITYSTVKAFVKNNKDAGLIMIDAHPDCESDFEPPTHEDLIRGLINNKILTPEKIILIGIRNWHSEEEKFLKKHKINIFNMKEISYEGIHDITESIMSIAKTWGSVYLSIDIDAVDPAFAPGTGYPEPAGLTSRELIYLINRFKNLKNLKMADIVEINPNIDTNNITVRLGAKVLKELL